jgi:hypothetical protein
MTSTAWLLSAGEILKQDNVGRVLTPLAKRQEILAPSDGSGILTDHTLRGFGLFDIRSDSCGSCQNWEAGSVFLEFPHEAGCRCGINWPEN